TFHKLKPGLLKNQDKVGKIEVVKIGIPPEAEIVAGPGDLRFVAKKRDPQSHKGDYGKVLVIGGSNQFTGAPAIASLAALKTGSDLVITVVPKNVSNTIRSYSPNLIVRDYSSSYLTPDSIPEFQNLFDWADAVILGPGLGKNEDTFTAIKKIIEIIKTKEIPTLIDADAIKALPSFKDLITGLPIVITPHFGEFKIFMGNEIQIPNNLEERTNMVRRAAQKYKITIVLKGHIDIISDHKRYKINKTGTAAMTVGGTGDCLSGIIGSLLGMRYETFRAAVAGTFLCGKAGELAEKDAMGPHILATDLLHHISFNKFL
ncbi:MAG: NAD(P)H-hydrate dehydratase, partial [Candidatus Helarchaeota archaeon]